MPTTTAPALAATERAAHLAEIVLSHGLAQRLPWRATEALLAVARSAPGIDPAAAARLVRAALAACVTHEVVAGREASR